MLPNQENTLYQNRRVRSAETYFYVTLSPLDSSSDSINKAFFLV
jgi:hypothetical protein